MQCGKEMDFGFESILKFITKINTGMGEQILPLLWNTSST
jgi:hypothetical protein